MKKVLFTIAAAVMMLAATSCKKENVNEPENDFNREPKANEFLASIDGGGMVQNAPRVGDGMNTMATFNPNDKLQVLWQQEDVIYVNGTAFTCNSNPSSDNRAYFVNENESPFYRYVYHAFYSTSVTPNADASGTLSATQYYNPERQAENLPMYATSTDHWLNFHNICAAIKIYVPCTADHIVISNTSKPMNGGFTVTVQSNVAVMDHANIPAENLTAEEKKITIYKGTLGNTEDFHACDSLFIAIPAGTYEGFEIAFYEGNTCVYTTGRSEEGKNLTVTANKIYRIVGYNYNKDPYLLPGKFEVGANSYAQFTAGNLWRDNLGDYHFEANQNGYQNTYDANHVGHFYNLDTTKVGGIEYDAWTSEEFKYLLGLQGTKVEGKENTYDWDCTSDLVSCAKVDGTWCLLVAPFGATAFNPNRHKYTLKEVNSMGLLCLPFAGNLANVQGKGPIVVYHSGAPKGDDGGTIMARYWASDLYIDDENYRWILCFDNKPDYQTLVTNEITPTTYHVPEAYGRSIRLMMRYPQE